MPRVAKILNSVPVVDEIRLFRASESMSMLVRPISLRTDLVQMKYDRFV